MKKFLHIIILVFIANLSYAQTGVLKGKVIDRKTKETVIGATVSLVGTYYAVPTDVNGNYTITNIKPGEYSVKIVYLGYKEQLNNGIKITNGNTTTLNVQLSEVTAEIGMVEVLGQKTIVDLESGKSSTKVTAEDIKDMSVKDVQSIVANQAGVSQNPDGLQIRGGRVYETQYLVDGINAQDPLAGTGFGVEIAANAINDIEVITGGVGAEFGEGTSGVVLTRIREGGDRVRVNGSYFRDNLGFNERSQWNTDMFSLSLGSPVPFTKKKLTFFGSVNMELTDEFFKTPARQLHSSLVPQNDSIWAPRQDNKWSNTLKFTYNIKPGKKISISNQNSLNINQNTRSLQIIGNNAIVTPGYQYLFSLNMDNASTYTHKSNLTIIQYLNLFNSKLSMDVSVARLFTNLRADANGRPFRPSTIDQIYDPQSIVTDPVTVYNPGDSIIFVNPGPGLYNNGGVSTLWHDHYAIENTFKVKFNYTPNKANFISFGIEHKEQEYQWVDVTRPWIGAPIIIDDTTTTASSSIGQTNDIWKVKPATGGIFIQDEIRYKGIIMNLGMRLNYWAPGKFADQSIEDPNAPVIDPIRESYLRNSTEILGRRFKFRLLPKLRISFPVSENNVLYFNYGHLSRLPHPRFVYAGLDPVYQNRSFLSNLGNPDINPEVTVSYEVGIKTQVTSNFAITATAFYNDKFDYIVSRRIVVKDQTGRFVEKNFSINQDYARIRGFEITLNRRIKKYLSVSFSGAYQIATGKSNSAQESQLQIIQNGAVSPTVEQYLAWDRPLDFKLMIIFKPDTSFRIGRVNFNNFRVFFNSTYKSGLRYTPNFQNGVTPTGRPIYEPDELNPFSEIGSAWWNTDIRITRDVPIKRGQMLSFSFEVKNLFDNKNAAIINPVTGRAYEAGDPLPNGFRDPNYPDPQDNGAPPFNPARFLSPRQVMFGVMWQF
ncbi:MAG: TonB-dependent receptor [bacterium]|jgi:outer membrane receptor protein involved in Fe transport